MILNNDILKKIEMRNILDLSVDINNTIDIIIKKWEYDMMSSDKLGYSPDMVSFLHSLLNRNAIIVIPKYKATTSSQNLNEKINIIPENRHGRLVGIQGNSKTFSFTIKIIDMNVINNDKLGEIRCFRLTDPEGNWYKGIDKLQIFNPNENKLTENKIYNSDIKFDYFIDPKRFTQFYNKKYFITKSLINRLKLESSHYYNQIKKMLDGGIKYPHEKDSTWNLIKQKGEKKLIKLFISEVFHPNYINEFPTFVSNQNNLVSLTEKRNKFIYSIIPRLQFVTRAIEYIFFHTDQDSIPEDIKKELGNVEWKNIKIKRTEWKELNLGEVGIRKRIFERMEMI